ncbi:site-specific integrase [Actinosynnema sp. ALI-1.44]|uniref:tyrosine-type recombinase/integrase n=1 Tax=Actinosynnema sp. ALI-1.44 TaxID=1933779 RepID=UPI00097C6349|nr:tyrosine-type recombinase/integrase [Actinosynnema sp. ALI-1.44]ONI77079.1 site-specific integrase [Actinosynnema sp. ALI-1.44]
MGTSKTAPKRRQRGEIETLPSGSLRVKIYAGIDPISDRRHYLTETIPAGPNAADEAEKVRIRLINEVNERRNPRTKATVNQLMDRYLELIDVDPNTRQGYERSIRNHIRPLIGGLQVGKLDGETLDSFYAVLRTCRAHCGGRRYIQHRTERPHKCDHRCGPHKCVGLSASSIRQIHWCLSGALKRAVRWRWLSVNPLEQTEPPKAPAPKPTPPTASQAAAIVNEAFRDLVWGVIIWLLMVTGVRRGELCALRWGQLNLDEAVLTISTSVSQDGAKIRVKDTKTHQQRRIALDTVTVMLLRLYLKLCEALAAEMAQKIAPEGYLFSASLDHSTPLKPDSVSQRYVRMCKKLGWDMNIHELRHYSATELIAAGVDPRTVAGRLGHGGGGTTTLRVYTAWVSESDQRAVKDIPSRMPTPPIAFESEGAAVSTLTPEPPNSPYLKIAADLQGAISCGALKVGDALPTLVEITQQYGVASSTASRAIQELKNLGLVAATRGRRTTVTSSRTAPPSATIVDLQSRRKQL